MMHQNMTGTRGGVLLLTAGASAVIALCDVMAGASTTTWQNVGSTWGTGSNWSPASVPSGGTVDASLPSVAAGSLVVPNLTANSATFGTLYIDNSNADYNITQSGGAWTLTPAAISITGGGTTSIAPTVPIYAPITAGTTALTLQSRVTHSGTGAITVSVSSSSGGSIRYAGGLQVGSSGASSARTATLSGSGIVYVDANLYSNKLATHKLTTASFSSGTLVIAATNAMFGGWEIGSGTAIMNGSSNTGDSTINGVATGAAGGVVVKGSGFLGGTGSLNNLTLDRGSIGGFGGRFKPGDQAGGAATGTFTVNGDFTLNAGTTSVGTVAQRAQTAGTLIMDINGVADHDSVVAFGAVELKGSPTANGNGRLVLNIASGFDYDSDVPFFIKLIDKQGNVANKISNTFWDVNAAEITEGSTFSFINSSAEELSFTYTYLGGDGNDFGVTVVGTVPEPGTALLAVPAALMACRRKRRTFSA